MKKSDKAKKPRQAKPGKIDESEFIDKMRAINKIKMELAKKNGIIL